MAFQDKLRKSSSEKLSEIPAGGNAWLDVHYDPVASLFTFSDCMALEDYNLDGDYEFLVGDLGSGHFDMKLKSYKGTELVHQAPLLFIPTALCTFYIDNTEPRTPAIAVASGSYIYMYKNLHPYFKFTLPSLQLNSTEADLWEQVNNDNIDASILKQLLNNMNDEVKDVPLTERSLKFMQLEGEDIYHFVKIFKHMPLKRQTTITCMCTLKKSHVDSDAVSCLVVGTENKDIYILDPVAFIILVKMSVPAVPVFLRVSGLYEVDYHVSVACRDSCIYTIKDGGRVPKYRIALGSQACGMQKMEQSVVVACMNQSLASYTVKGRRLWSHMLPSPVTVLELLDYQPQGVRGVIVAMKNCEIRLYRDKNLVNSFQVADVVMGLKFGQYGREDGSLLMVTQGGSLIIKILKRTAMLDDKGSLPHGGPPKAQAIKLNLPKKTKVIVDQTVREREQFAAIHSVFQQDLLRLKLETARSYAKAISASMIPITSSDQNESLKITAQVQGLGPVFQLTVSLVNSATTSARNLAITFQCDELLYRIHKKYIQVPLLVPQLEYKFLTTVECLDDLGRSEDISVFVVRRATPKPLITAVINMPLSENVITV